MPQTANKQTTRETPVSNRTKGGHLAPQCRVVHVAVPELVFNHAKAQAYLSGLRWPDFVSRLLKESKAFPTE